MDTLQLGHPQYLQQFPFYWGVDCSYITTFTTVYKLNYTWVITLMLASTVLAATGLVGIFASLAIRGPDVFDPVIGLTYGNPYLAISGYGSALSATERAKMLGELRVRLGDV